MEPFPKFVKNLGKAFKGLLPKASDNEVFGPQSLSNDFIHSFPPMGSVAFVGAGPGDAELLTIKAYNALKAADVVAFDALVSDDVLKLCNEKAHLVFVGKRFGLPSHSQNEINELIKKYALKGYKVVRLKSGDPAVFGRLGEELDALKSFGISCEIIPGITAASAACAVAQAPLTERTIASETRIISLHAKDGLASINWKELALSDAPIAVYMGRKYVHELQRLLVLNGRVDTTPVVIVENASRPEAAIHHCVLSTLAKTVLSCPPNTPLVMLIGVRSRLIGNTKTIVNSINTSPKEKPIFKEKVM